MTATLERRAGALRRGHHERRRVGRRLRLRERRARAHRGRRSRRPRRASTGTRWRSGRRSRCASRSCAGAPVFGLPGNPVSSLVSFELFARPALLAMMGRTELLPPRGHARARSTRSPRKPDGKLHLDRVPRSGRGRPLRRRERREAGEQHAGRHRAGRRARAPARRRRRRRQATTSRVMLLD